MKTEIVQGFDEALWKEGVAEGAFAGDKDPDGVWYLLQVDGEKVALAAAVPGPADLTNVSYYVHPDYRGLGYGTKIASRVTDLHEKATFTIFKDNDASIKVALAALRNKFSMTMGHNVVRLTKTAAKAKVEEEPEKPKVKGPPLITYLDDIGMILKGLKSDVPALAETALKAAEAREMLKQAISIQTAETALQTRLLQSRLKGISSPQALNRRVTAAAEVVAKKPTTALAPEDRKAILGTTRFVREGMGGAKGGGLFKSIESAKANASHQMELPA